MKTIFRLLSLTTILTIFFTSCGSTSSTENLDFIKADKPEQVKVDDNLTTPPVTFGNDRVYHVGRNSEVFDGTLSSSSITEVLKTIAEDINNSKQFNKKPFSYSDVTLKIHEGSYGAETNETYPILFPANIKVIGEGNVTINNEKERNLGSLEDLNDPIMIMIISLLANELDPMIKLGDSCILDSINISSGYGVGIMIESSTHAILKNSKVFISKTGLRVMDDAQLTLLNTSLYENSLAIEVRDSAKVILKGTKISSNDIGIKSSHTSQLQFADKNLIANNTFCGLYDRGIGSELTLSTQIEWDASQIHDECTNGVSIASNQDRNIIFQRVPNYIKLFSDIPTIELTYPQHKSTITTTTPNIIWNPTPNNVVTKVAIFNSLPIVNAQQIINKEDILWYWNSDTNDISKLGNLAYSDGISKSSLIKGKGYYYAIFEMNKSQTKVTASSPVYFFTINGDY